jgi:phosphoribosyl-ATP pyrophosphohydrolase/phosphoribosyl-AMP cyclohydrolase
LKETQSSKKVVFFSRSKQRLWMKGETSGHLLEVVDIRVDCDHDALLILVHPHGPTCHTGQVSCFGAVSEKRPHSTTAAACADWAFLGALERRLLDRSQASPEDSYTARLLHSGIKRMAQKVGEEGVEVALAAVSEDDKALTEEAADLVYHLMVLLQSRKCGFKDVISVLQLRHNFK